MKNIFQLVVLFFLIVLGGCATTHIDSNRSENYVRNMQLASDSETQFLQIYYIKKTFENDFYAGIQYFLGNQ
ncbi:hypothetical protein GKC56_03605 [Neisseriaceae bacterium PsAf]|nr:hypothetical protein [Neisseriaceae bacterium PsAf]MCV2503720.1 hypothetical protein [Neisseriaceae bacterium]